MITALFAPGSFTQFQSLFEFCLSSLQFLCSLKGGPRRRYAPGLPRTHQQLFLTHEKTNFSVKSSLQGRHRFFFCFVFVLVSLYRARVLENFSLRRRYHVKSQKIGFQYRVTWRKPEQYRPILCSRETRPLGMILEPKPIEMRHSKWGNMSHVFRPC